MSNPVSVTLNLKQSRVKLYTLIKDFIYSQFFKELSFLSSSYSISFYKIIDIIAIYLKGNPYYIIQTRDFNAIRCFSLPIWFNNDYYTRF